MAEVLEADELCQFIDTFFDLRARGFLDLQAERHIFAHGHVTEQCVVLEHEADAALAGGYVVDAAAADEDVAAVWCLESRDHAQNRRLARARRAEQADEAAFFDGKRHITARLERAEGFVDMVELDLDVIRHG